MAGVSVDDEAFVFDMGLYPAVLPVRLRYTEIHFWFDVREQHTRCGLTSYAMRLLDDVFRLDWKVTVGQDIREADPLGEIESTKASSELYAPMTGRLVAINREVVASPRRLTVDPYAEWLLEFEGRPEQALDAAGYRDYLAATWEETQRLLKGQA